MKKPNIIWFMLDSLRNDFLNEFGAPFERTFVDDLISTGVSFTNCFSAAPFTQVSMAAKFSSCYPPLNGIDAWMLKNPLKSFNNLIVTFPEILRFNGYQTFYKATSISCPYISPLGFDNYYAQSDSHDIPIDDYAQYCDGNKFLMIAFDVIHDSCCKSPITFTSYDYHKAVVDLSAVVKSYYERIKTDNDLIIITSDHGCRVIDELQGTKYENERVTGRYLTDKTTKNSFNIIWNNVVQPQKISNMTRGVDIMPTILDLLGMEYPKYDGVSLLYYITGKGNVPAIKYAYTMTGWSQTHSTSPGCWCVRNERYKLVRTEYISIFGRKSYGYELYDYVNDKLESIDLSKQKKEVFNELCNEMEKMFLIPRSNNVLTNYSFDSQKYFEYRQTYPCSRSLNYANSIIKNHWQAIVRPRFMRAYKLNKIKKIISYITGYKNHLYCFSPSKTYKK